MCGVRERSSRDRWRLSKCGACVYTAHNFVTAYVNYFGVAWRVESKERRSGTHYQSVTLGIRILVGGLFCLRLFAFCLFLFFSAVFQPTVSRGSWVHVSTACCRVFSLMYLHYILFFSFTF